MLQAHAPLEFVGRDENEHGTLPVVEQGFLRGFGFVVGHVFFMRFLRQKVKSNDYLNAYFAISMRPRSGYPHTCEDERLPPGIRSPIPLSHLRVCPP